MMKLTELLTMRKKCWIAVSVNIQLGWVGSIPRAQHRLVLSLTLDCKEILAISLVVSISKLREGIKNIQMKVSLQSGD